MFDLFTYLLGKKNGGGGSSVTVEELSVNENGTYTAETGHAYSPVNVSVPTGGGAVEEKDVNFYDYDGTRLYSYTAAEFAELTELPANPSHEGLTAQGWNIPSNWTLANAKAEVAATGAMDLGQMYVTDDGKTRVYIHLNEGRTSPMLGCCPDGTVDVDWGDGTAHDTLTGTSTSTVKWTPTHNYAAPGDYVIKLTVTGEMALYGTNTTNQFCGLLRYSITGDVRNRVYQSSIQRVEIGVGVTSIGAAAFRYCSSLSSITIPNSATNIGTYAFAYCYSLSNITIPSGVTGIGDCAFQYCYSLSNVTIPSSVTSISAYAFAYCYSLSNITIPSGVTSIEEYALQTCYCLLGITIPSSVIGINSNAFQYCVALSNITIPSGVTSIGDNALSGLSGLGEIHFKPETPPTISNSNAFASLPTDCKIYVPAGHLADYTSAQNYPSSSTYTYVEE